MGPPPEPFVLLAFVLLVGLSLTAVFVITAVWYTYERAVTIAATRTEPPEPPDDTERVD